MDDEKLIGLLLARNESAIAELKAEYEEYCMTIAENILGNKEDAEECFNDALFSVWSSVPPVLPKDMKVYLGRITRNKAISMYRSKNASKRAGQYVQKVFDDLSFTSSGPEKELLQKELDDAVLRFLKTLTKRDRDIFLCRYYFFFTSEKIADRHGLSRNHVLTILSRTRKKLENMLKKEGLI